MKDNKDFINYEYNEVEDSSWIRSASEKDTDTPIRSVAVNTIENSDSKVTSSILAAYSKLSSFAKKLKKLITFIKHKLNKKRIIITSIITIIIAITAIITITLLSTHVIIAGEVFSKSDTAVMLSNKTIHQYDLNQLKKFKNLEMISISNCEFATENLSNIAIKELDTLHIGNCNLTNAQLNSIDFNTLENLYSLDLSDNDRLTNFESLSPLADNLEDLCIDNTSPNSLKSIKTFTKIKDLSIDQVGISGIDFVSNMLYLEYFSAEGNNITSLNGLKNATVLNWVILNNNRISDVSILSNSKDTLQYIVLDNNSISDLSALANCTSITHFSANYNQLTSTEWLAEWTKLSSLSLSNNKIKNFDGYLQNKALEEIDLSNNKLTKIENIAFQTYSFNANFSHNTITSVNLPENCYFYKLALHGNPLKDTAFFKKTNGFKITFDFFDELEPQILKDVNFSKIYIVDCPTDRIVKMEQASDSVIITTSDEINNLSSEQPDE